MTGRKLQRKRLEAVRDHVTKLGSRPEEMDHEDQLVYSGREAIDEIVRGHVVRWLDMSVILSSGQNPETDACGCVIGVTASLFPAETEAAYDAIEKKTGAANASGAAARVLGLSAVQATALFYGSTDEDARPLDALTGAEVGAAIGRLLDGAEAHRIWKD